MPHQHRAGKTGQFLVDGSALTMTEFSPEETGDDTDIVSFENTIDGICYDDGLVGVQALAIAVKGIWDFTNPQTGDPPGLYVRDDLESVEAVPSSLHGAQSYYMDNARVLSSKNTTAVRGGVSFDCSIKSKGEYSTPG